MAISAEQTGAIEASGAPTHQATFRQLSDLYLLAEGGYTPVAGFLNAKDTSSVAETMNLTSGEPWSIPIIFPIDADTKQRIGSASQIILKDGDVVAGVLNVEEIFEIDKAQYSKNVFRTEDPEHPGVAWLRDAGDFSVAGTVDVAADWKLDIPGTLPISPSVTRAIIEEKGWKKIVGFQTHRAHEFCTKIALETADGLVIHPLLGETKSDDTPADVRLACYDVLIKNYYPADHAMLAGFPAWMRYAGPREAVFHAQVRKNYGITHFIVGRDHAGVGDYYGPFDAQQIFSEFAPGELGVDVIFFDFVHFCKKCGGMASTKTCPHPKEDHVHLTGRAVRQMLIEGTTPPPEFTRPEIAQILIKAARAA
ncbi:MAG: sulfate adenylyltransferase [Verrucomicrobia bacterium]|nr:sulfate adenylyltransferase [Verrucomicrobiota bacterium]